VSTMTTPDVSNDPGAGLQAGADGTPAPGRVEGLDEATVRLIYRNMLVGGEPSQGKSTLLNLAVLAAVLNPEVTGVALVDGKEAPSCPG